MFFHLKRFGNLSKICFINRYIHCACFQLSRLRSDNCFQHTSLHQNHQEHPQNQPISGFHRKTLWFLCETHKLQPTIPCQKNTPQKKPNGKSIFPSELLTSPLWAWTGPCWIHRCESAEMAGFLVALKFLTVLTVDLAVNALGGRGLLENSRPQKMCKWWEVCVLIQMKPLEKVSRNHLHFFKDVLKVMSFYCGGFQETNTFHQKHPNEKWYVSRKRDGPLSFIYFKGRIRRSLFNQFTWARNTCYVQIS